LNPIIWHKIANASYEVSNGSKFLGKPYEPNAIIKNDMEFILMQRRPGGYRQPTTAQRDKSPIATAFGGLLLAAGILLSVAAHWDSLSPAWRFGLVLALVAVMHVAGVFTAERFRALSTTLHAVGTICLGAGIFLTGQIFHLKKPKFRE